MDKKLRGEFWITAGAEAPTVKVVTDGLNNDKYLQEHYYPRIKFPKMVKPETFDRLVKPVFLPALPKRFKRMFEEASLYLKYLDMAEPFPTDVERLSRYETGPQPTDVVDLIALNLKSLDVKHGLSEQLVLGSHSVASEVA